MKKTLSIFFLLLNALLSISQCDLTLQGKVIDHHDRQPLEFATIFIKESGKGAITDSLGYYVISGLCPGTYTITCVHIGCDSISELITITADQTKNFYPEHHLHELGLVNIVSEKVPEKTVQPSYEMKGRELDEQRGESLGQALKTITGVNTIQTGGNVSKPVIHGMHSNRILILNNGIRQEGQQWGSEHAPEIDPFIANKLTVIKGANSVRYGSDAIAGVILVEPNKLRDSAGVGAEVNLVGMSNGRSGTASAMLEQNFKKIPALSWRLQGTLKQSGATHTPTYYLKNTGMKEYNFSAAAGWKKEKYGAEIFYSQFNTTLGIFAGAHIGNVSDLYDAINRTEPLEKGEFTYSIDRPYQHIEHELFKAKAFVLTGKAGKLNIIYARQYNLRNEFSKDKPLNDSLAALNKPELQFEITSHSADLTWEHNYIKHFTGMIGVSGMTQGNTYSGRYFIPNYRNYSGGIYWIEKYSRNKFQLEAGIRYDYRWLRIYKYEGKVIVSPIYNYENVSGTLTAVYKASKKVSFNFNAGSAWRPPAVNELYSDGIHHGSATFEIGDKTLKPEKAYNFIAGMNYHSEKLHAEVELYHNIIDDYINLQPQIPATVTIHGSFPTFVYTQSDATFTGLDAQLSYYIIPQLLITGKASVLRAFNKTTNDWLIQMPSDRFSGEITYNFKKAKKISESYITLNAEYTNKQWRVPANSDYLSPPKAYTLINLEMGTTVHLGTQTITIGIGCNNLLNTSYRNYMNRFRYYSDEMGRNITLRLKIPINYSPKTKSTEK
ncbi:MAG: hypothetical protein K0S44_937 [Bacteroidetes bacterium]|jgi:iron complex outermembrane receptor protein|nr:hypothetical protein [Bacteroidota bacterium]